LEKLMAEMCWGAFGFWQWNSDTKSPHTFDVFRWSPFVFLYAISLPMYEVLKFSLEDSAVKDEFYLVFLNTVMDDRGRRVMLNSLSYHICIVGS